MTNGERPRLGSRSSSSATAFSSLQSCPNQPSASGVQVGVDCIILRQQRGRLRRCRRCCHNEGTLVSGERNTRLAAPRIVGLRSLPAMLVFRKRLHRTLIDHIERRCQASRGAGAAALFCAACASSVDPIAVAPDCPSQPLRAPAMYAGEPSDRLVSDFEGGTTELVEVADRDGSWIHGRDLTSVRVTIGPSNDCAARGQWAGHLAASEPTSWGNNWTAHFRRPGKTPVPYDGSQYGGVSFWAAFGARNGPSFGVPFGIVTVDTTRPSCSSHCEDHYMAEVTLTRDWRRYELRFDDLKQQEDPQLPMRRDQMVGFIIWTQQQCDVWIDDVRLEP
jgi:hypothetical protein